MATGMHPSCPLCFETARSGSFLVDVHPTNYRQPSLPLRNRHFTVESVRGASGITAISTGIDARLCTVRLKCTDEETLTYKVRVSNIQGLAEAINHGGCRYVLSLMRVVPFRVSTARLMKGHSSGSFATLMKAALWLARFTNPAH